jgi:hypothetical protein
MNIIARYRIIYEYIIRKDTLSDCTSLNSVSGYSRLYILYDAYVCVIKYILGAAKVLSICKAISLSLSLPVELVFLCDYNIHAEAYYL